MVSILISKLCEGCELEHVTPLSKNYLWIYRGRGPALSHSHSLLSLFSLYSTDKHITRGRGVDVVDFVVVRVVGTVVCWDPQR